MGIPTAGSGGGGAAGAAGGGAGGGAAGGGYAYPSGAGAGGYGHAPAIYASFPSAAGTSSSSASSRPPPSSSASTSAASGAGGYGQPQRSTQGGPSQVAQYAPSANRNAGGAGVGGGAGGGGPAFPFVPLAQDYDDPEDNAFDLNFVVPSYDVPSIPSVTSRGGYLATPGVPTVDNGFHGTGPGASTAGGMRAPAVAGGGGGGAAVGRPPTGVAAGHAPSATPGYTSASTAGRPATGVPKDYYSQPLDFSYVYDNPNIPTTVPKPSGAGTAQGPGGGVTGTAGKPAPSIGPAKPSAIIMPPAGGAPGAAQAPGASTSTSSTAEGSQTASGKMLLAIQNILDKIGPKNFTTLVDELIDHINGQCRHETPGGEQRSCPGIRTRFDLEDLSDIIFESAIHDHNYSDIFAQMVRDIAPYCPRVENFDLETLLVERCQTEFNDFLHYPDDDEEDYDEDEPYQYGERRRKRAVANALFIGELYNVDLFPTDEFLRILFLLLEEPRDADGLEMCVTLFRTSGKILEAGGHRARTTAAAGAAGEQPQDALSTKNFLLSAFTLLEQYLAQGQLEPYIATKIRELLDFRANNWTKPQSQRTASKTTTEESTRRNFITAARRLPKPAAGTPAAGPGGGGGAAAPPGAATSQAKPGPAAAGAPVTIGAPVSSGAGAGNGAPAGAGTGGTVVRVPAGATGTSTGTTGGAGAAGGKPTPVITVPSSGGGAAAAGAAPAGGGGAAKPAPGAAPQTSVAGGVKLTPEQLQQIKTTANIILNPVKKHLDLGEDMQRKIAARAIPSERVPYVNETWFKLLNEITEDLYVQVGNVPFLTKLMSLIAAYAKQTSKDRSTYDTRCLASLQTSIRTLLSQIENALKGPSFSAPATKPGPGTSTSASTGSSTSAGSTSAGSTTISVPGGATARPAVGPSTGAPQGASTAGTGAKPQPTASKTAPTVVKPTPVMTGTLASVKPGPSTASQAAAAAPPKPKPEPERRPGWVDPSLELLLNRRSFNELIGGWESEMAGFMDELSRGARQVAEMDRTLIDNDAKLFDLRQKLLLVDVSQVELEKSMLLLNQHQYEMNQLLNDLEEKFQRTQSESDPDGQREDAFRVARKVDGELHQIAKALADITSMFNSAAAAQEQTTDEAVRQLEEILNNNLRAMQWIDTTSKGVEKRLRSVEQRNIRHRTHRVHKGRVSHG